jgi:hypothetical protein
MDPTLPSADSPVVPLSIRPAPPLPPPAPAPPPPAPRRRFRWWRVLRALIAFGFLVVAGSVIALVFGLYLGATGRNLPMLRAAVSVVGRAVAGQRTTAVVTRVELRPAARALSGEATLTVRADTEGRQRLYFLLNDGLRLRDAWQAGDADARTALATMRLGPLAVITLARPLAAGESAADHPRVWRPGEAGRPHRQRRGDPGRRRHPHPADFWYPSDVQGPFDADVEVTLPADLTLVHNGHEEQRFVEGTSARVRFTSERPVAGLALVAGRYSGTRARTAITAIQLFLPPGSDLDAEKVLESMVVAEHGLAEHFGPSGFSRATLYVPPRLPRAFQRRQRPARHSAALLPRRPLRLRDRRTRAGAQLVGRDGRREVARPRHRRRVDRRRLRPVLELARRR